MKKIVYGPSGYGKSYNIVSQIMRQGKNNVLVSMNGAKHELDYMNIREEFFSFIALEQLKDVSVSGNIGVKLPCNSAAAMDRKLEEEKVLRALIQSGVTRREDITIILIGFYGLVNTKEFIKQLEHWKANIVIEYTCTQEGLDAGELIHYLNDASWEKIRVFKNLDTTKPLFKKANKAGVIIKSYSERNFSKEEFNNILQEHFFTSRKDGVSYMYITSKAICDENGVVVNVVNDGYATLYEYSKDVDNINVEGCGVEFNF